MRAAGSITSFARWLAREHGFLQLPAENRRATWHAVALTHVFILGLSIGATAVAPGLRLSVHDILITHFVMGLLVAKLVDVHTAIGAMFRAQRPPVWPSGWLFVFSLTLIPLFFGAFTLWAIA